MDDAASLQTLRQDVRALDDRIYQLMAERLALARRIGAVKDKANLPIKDYQVEKEVIDRARARARELGVYEGMAEDVARLLIKYAVLTQDARRLQDHRKKTAAAQKILIAGGRGRMGRWLSDFFESFGHAVSHVDPGGTGEPSHYPLHADLQAVAGAQDVIVLSAPITTCPALLETLADSGTGALVFDICSLKTPLLPSIRKAQQRGLKVTSVHPMFGPQVDVLSGRNVIVCDAGDAALTARTRALFEGTTANLVVLPLERHDELMSYVLGLSHLTNLIFGAVLSTSGKDFKELRQVASTTFNAQLDVAVPVAHENQDLYFEIQAENAFTPELVKALGKALDAYGGAIAKGDKVAFRQLMLATSKYLGKG